MSEPAKSEIINAPFTPEQCEQLNRYQKSGLMHPFTCGSGRRTDKDHLDGEGILVATPEGWKCPFCDYRQDYAHSFMADKEFLDALEDEHRRIFGTPLFG